jgi:hypothetical protein
MTDWSVSRKLDEIKEQNKEIINLMKMQIIVAILMLIFMS